VSRLFPACVFVLASCGPALATWSVIALDPKTGTVVVASAACVVQRDVAGLRAKGLMDVQAIVVPGKGAAVAQAEFDGSRASQRLIYAELQKGTDPETILFMLRQDPSSGTRQFGILDMEGRHAGFSGAGNQPVSLHEQGEISGAGIWYSVQGDTLPGEDVVHAAVQALTEYSGELADRVMAAMEAADARGGDRRCSCESQPKVNAPCETKTAQVAYLVRAEKNDSNKESYNDGKYAMYISVTNDDIKPTENANPVKTLRMRYEAWKRNRPD
jgi:uncharacterized Ntn-hydrolase superfamily protein